jgi:hypothetical protein
MRLVRLRIRHTLIQAPPSCDSSRAIRTRGEQAGRNSVEVGYDVLVLA